MSFNRFLLFLIGLSLYFSPSALSAQGIASEKIIICGVCKNVAPFLPITISSIESIGSKFADYRVFIYENNSSDRTATSLKEWANVNPRICVTCENLSREELSKEASAYAWDGMPSRMEMIARARNIVLAQAMDPKFDDFKYVLMADLDFSKPWDILGILDSFHQNVEWDAICANGIASNGTMYDLFAFRAPVRPLGPELVGDKWWNESFAFRLSAKDALYPVYSAFGGLAIYKRRSIQGCTYSGVVNRDLEVFTRRLIENNQNDIHIRKYLDQNESGLSVVYLDNQNRGIKWTLNSGYYKFPVCCEHITFYASMILKGHDKIFINPRMVMRY